MRLAMAPSVSPMVEIHNLKDKAADGGYLLRCTYREPSTVILSQYPQLGPRKEDPNDSTPQYDAQRRASVRLKPIHIARLLTLMEGKDAGFAKSSDGSHRFPYGMGVAMDKDVLKIEGEVQQMGQDDKVPFNVHLSSTQLITFYRFMESTLVESFGFKQIPRGVVPTPGIGGKMGGR